MSEQLNAIFESQLMGRLIYDSKKDLVTFHYDERWRHSEEAFPLSLSMPITNPNHVDAIVRPFITGLLPDNDAVLKRWGKQHQVSPRNPFRLLRYIGEECAGAIQFIPPDHSQEWLTEKAPKGIDWLDGDELEQRIQDLVDDPSAARRPGDRGQFSLAGAQPKLGLYRDTDNKRWGIPSGITPTTHIFKPNVGDFESFNKNEHFCLSLAKRIGLQTPDSSVQLIGDIPVIIVKRYDRTKRGEDIIRVHQEDCCQALARTPDNKYEKDGGPSAKEIFSLIRDHSTNPRQDEIRFLDAMIFNWLIMGTDAHSKNYSVLLAAGPQVRLAPLYDLLSYYPYERAGEQKKTKLAMKIGGEYKFYRINLRTWEKAAKEWKLDWDIVLKHIIDQTQIIPEAAASVGREMASTNSTNDKVVNRLVEKISENAAGIHKLFK